MAFKFSPGHCGESPCGCGPGCPSCPACPDFVWLDEFADPHPMSCCPYLTLNVVNGVIGGFDALLIPSPTDACKFERFCSVGHKIYVLFDATVSPPTLTVRYYASGCGGGFVTCGPLTPDPDFAFCDGVSLNFDYTPTFAGCPALVTAGYTLFSVIV